MNVGSSTEDIVRSRVGTTTHLLPDRIMRDEPAIRARPTDGQRTPTMSSFGHPADWFA